MNENLLLGLTGLIDLFQLCRIDSTEGFPAFIDAHVEPVPFDRLVPIGIEYFADNARSYLITFVTHILHCMITYWQVSLASECIQRQPARRSSSQRPATFLEPLTAMQSFQMQ